MDSIKFMTPPYIQNSAQALKKNSFGDAIGGFICRFGKSIFNKNLLVLYAELSHTHNFWEFNTVKIKVYEQGSIIINIVGKF